MRAPEKHVALWLVFLAGAAAAVLGVTQLLLMRHLGTAGAETVLGLVLLAWVIFHPARVPEDAQLDDL